MKIKLILLVIAVTLIVVTVGCGIADESNKAPNNPDYPEMPQVSKADSDNTFCLM